MQTRNSPSLGLVEQKCSVNLLSYNRTLTLVSLYTCRRNVQPVEPTILSQSPPIPKNFSSKYIGVYLHQKNDTYVSKITYKEKIHDLGQFIICADAALMYDSCIKCVDGQNKFKSNFSNNADHKRAREQEMAERGIDSPGITDVLAIINDRVDKFLSKITKSCNNNGMGEAVR